ncbi:MAG: VCBS repeat-containing protein, partial [Thermoanaerobaculia bacterium]|nr:VCBS repeat-containing protein [Thermoanaerobaculia bacterium]
MLRLSSAVACWLFLASLGSLQAQDEPPEMPTVPVPPPQEEEILERRAAAQERKLEAVGRTPGFRLENRVEESGIEFVHRIVDDAGKHYKMVHYDHGNGIAAADVDGDDRIDLYFLTQLGGNELWRNLGDGTFEEITDRAGVGVDDRISVAAAFGDSDNDGDADLYVTTVNQGNLFFENLGKGEFRDATESSGLGHRGHSSGALWLDYDRDGLLDLFVSNVGRYTTIGQGRGGYFVGLREAFSGHLFPERFERSLLFRNLGDNRFEEVSRSVGLVDDGWTGDAIAADFDDDGWIDLYLPNMQGDDRLWLNREGKEFVEATDRFFPKTPWGTMGITLVDADADGAFDLYLTDMHSDMSKKVGWKDEGKKSDMQWSEAHLQGGGDNLFGNALYRQTAEGPWKEISDQAGVELYWPWGVSAADFDADGLEDLFVTTSMNYPWRYQPNSLLWNVGGRFVDVAFPVGLEPRKGGRTYTPWFVADCSGAEKDESYCEGRSGEIQVLGALGSRSSVAFDLEGDGDLDVVTNEFHSAPQVLVNEPLKGAESSWVKIDLRGSTSNRSGLGAAVTVRTKEDFHTRVHTGKSGYLAQSSLPL